MGRLEWVERRVRGGRGVVRRVQEAGQMGSRGELLRVQSWVRRGRGED